METCMMRIGSGDKKILEQISKEEHEAQIKILHKAIEEYRRKIFLRKVNLAFGNLKKNRAQSQSLSKEMKAWEVTLMDGLEDEGNE